MMLFVAADPSRPSRSSFCRWGAACLAALLLLLLTAPASGDAPPQVYGVSDGEVVTDARVIWTEAQRVSHWMSLRLTGPGTDLDARGAGRRLHLVESGSTGTPLSWDASRAEPGDYTLRAVSYVRDRPIDRRTVQFRVERASVPDVAEVLADPPPVLPVELTPGGGAQASIETDDTRADVELPKAKFGAARPETLVENAAWSLPIELSGGMPRGGDLLLLAWDLDRNEIVEDFAHTVDKAPWQVSGAHVAELPTGRMELQLHVRHGSRFVQTDKVAVTVKPASGARPGRLPRVGFAAGTPTRYERGSTSSLMLDVGGPLPDGADLLVIAWSLGRGELVESFAGTLTQPPWAITANQLNKLPDGPVEVQVFTRIDGQSKRKTTHTINVVPAPGTNPGKVEDEANPPTTGDGSEAPGRNPVSPGTDREPMRNPSAPDPMPTPDPDTNAGAPATGGEGTPTTGDTVTRPGPTSPMPRTIAFTADAPDAYTRGSDAVVKVEVDGSLPEDGDILLIAWDKSRETLVPSFAHTLQGGERRVRNGQLDKLPAGRIELQAHLRLENATLQIAKRDVRVAVPGEPDVEPAPQPEAPEAVAPGSGFGAYPPANGARVIYVSSSGSDANSGLSPSAPLKSPGRGLEMLRDGYPDQLLFKAGDVFTGGLGSFAKSGRSADAKMVIGVYGNGDRPLFRTGDGNFLSVHNTVRNLAIVGLHGYSNRRDPSSPDFRSNDIPYLATGVAWYGKAENIVFEDVHLEWYKDNFVFQAPSGGAIHHVLLYRVISNNAWCDHHEGHSQGLFAKNVYDMEIVESTFDHNGWRPGNQSDRTKFNHNMYIQKDCKRVDVRRTLVTRGCHNGVQLRGGGDLVDNLFSHNSIGAYLAQEPSVARGNVFLHSQDLRGDYPLGHGLQVLPCSDATVEDNLFAHKNATAGFTPAIEIAWRDDIIDPPGSFNVELRRNIIAAWPVANNGRSIRKTTGSANIRVDAGNVLDRESGGGGDPPFVDPSRDLDGYGASVGAGNHEGFLRAAVHRGRGAWEDRFAASGAIDWVRAGFDYLPYD